ncbi:T9SS type A sorting domain-containing protein [Flavobacteriaceae bacterium Ap0902]|nr:T9SS type A sorting domain-containing protein [Flavobacteriaceae bacterium Ap0902]
MKKSLFLFMLLFCFIGYSQNNNPDVNSNGKSTVYSDDVKLPVAYSQNSGIAITEDVKQTTNWQGIRNSKMPFTGRFYADNSNGLVYYNGPYWNVQGNPNKNMLETISLGMNTIGSQASLVYNTSLADDLILNVDVSVSSIDFFAYQTGAEIPSVTAVYLQVWDGDPSSGTANVIWGDLTTNIIGEVSYAQANRVTEEAQDDTTRKIQRVQALTPGLDLNAGTYWLQFTFDGSSSSGPWVPPIAILGEPTTGNAMQFQTIEGESFWVPTQDSGTDTQQGFPFMVYGEITSNDDFPTPYCEIDAIVAEPITLVEVASISNRSSNNLDDAIAHEDYVTITGYMTENETYTINLEGNTNGEHPATFTVFIDWNQDEIFNSEDERYEVGSIYNSTGMDGIQASNVITVPPGVAHGQTRMRIIKLLGTAYAADGCTDLTWGQAEDYTIDVTATGDNAPFPAPYCGPIDFNLAVEPISLVRMEGAGIENESSSALNDSPTHEDFTSIIGEVTEGQSYPITVEGNTDGYFNSITVFIDWNQDGYMDNEGERYNIGIMNGTNADIQQVTGDILVPNGVQEGLTRMRVVKRYTSSEVDYAIDSCNPGSNYGQVEDYSINVTLNTMDVIDVDQKNFSYYPNPTSGNLYLNAESNIQSVVFYNMLGQKVRETNVNTSNPVINLSGLKYGNYIMQVTIDGKTKSYKILKK